MRSCLKAVQPTFQGSSFTAMLGDRAGLGDADDFKSFLLLSVTPSPILFKIKVTKLDFDSIHAYFGPLLIPYLRCVDSCPCLLRNSVT